MSLQRALDGLLQAGAKGSGLYTLVNPWGSRRKFAAFAYIAGQYGYEYDGLAPGVPRSLNYPVFAFRRLPDAEQRAAHTAAQHPNARFGGPYPGMRPGGDGLTPLAETRTEVDLLHARIKVDLFGKSAGKRVRKLAVLVPIGVFLALLINQSFTATAFIVAGGICVAWCLYLWLASEIMRRRHHHYRRTLADAGIRWPPDRNT
ncbi:hypothetical protein [Streptomyces boninensis]|uniref:hypothetical protein n=1 Tax=Streptomyces boninensis TaxID=2039455 RepID=UPI003B21E0A5